jgi:putative membrane protein
MSTGFEKWRRTSPLAALFYLGRVLEHVTRNLTQTLVPLAAFLLAAKGDLVGKIGFAVVAFIMITITIAFLRYWFFGYRISDESVLIREGVFRKTQLDIKFDRIQAINLEQNLVFRAFNLVTVKFDTAGSSQVEGYLPAIKKSWADELKGRIRPVPQAGRAREDVNIASTGAGHVNGSTDPAGGEARTLLTLTFRDIVKVGLSNNRSLIFLAFLAPLTDTLDEMIRENVSEEIVAGASVNVVVVGVSEGTAMALLIFAGVMIFIALASISGALLRFHRFTVFAGDDVFRSIGGLLTRHEHSIPFNKIQSVIANQGVMLRCEPGSDAEDFQQISFAGKAGDQRKARQMQELRHSAGGSPTIIEPGCLVVSGRIS